MRFCCISSGTPSRGDVHTILPGQLRAQGKFALRQQRDGVQNTSRGVDSWCFFVRAAISNRRAVEGLPKVCIACTLEGISHRCDDRGFVSKHGGGRLTQPIQKFLVCPQFLGVGCASDSLLLATTQQIKLHHVAAHVGLFLLTCYKMQVGLLDITGSVQFVF